MAKTFFGTDGIRGSANKYPLDCETVVSVGRALAAFFAKEGRGHGRFIIGQDTRISGDMLVSAICAGICSMGQDVYAAGVIPTPAVACLTKRGGFDAGIMISASHNPFADNGIKLFDGNGYKLTDGDEEEIEAKIASMVARTPAKDPIVRVGRVHRIEDAASRYRGFLAATVSDAGFLEGVKLVVDGSNGAASRIAPALFADLGAKVTAIYCDPDGVNINEGCGSQHPQVLAETVVAEKADLGLAFDGDADRLIAVDEKGKVLTGDQVIAICAQEMKSRERLDQDTVVTTVMSNMGLGIALKKMGVHHVKAGVGDRYVMQEMIKAKAVLGGEDSGHMIFLDHHTTGDGLLAALRLLCAMNAAGRPLSALARVMDVFPQCLINVNVRSKPEIETVDSVMAAIQGVERQLGDRGRVLVRYSGTQPQCRVMVEGPTEDETGSLCQLIAAAVKEALG